MAELRSTIRAEGDRDKTESTDGKEGGPSHRAVIHKRTLDIHNITTSNLHDHN